MSYFDEIDKSVFEKNYEYLPIEIRENLYSNFIKECDEFKTWFRYYYDFLHPLRYEHKFIKEIISDEFLMWFLRAVEGDDCDGKYETFLTMLKENFESVYRGKNAPGLNSIKSFIMYCAFRERHRLQVYE